MLEKIRSQIGLSSFSLRCFAIAVMLVDHLGAFLWNTQEYIWLRIIGRLAFPVFAFLIVQGFIHTGNVTRYAVRLAIFALISEIPYNLANGGELLRPDRQNVFFTLLLGLFALILIKSNVHMIMRLAGIAAILSVAEFMRCDYKGNGVLLIILLYAAGNSVIGQLGAIVFFSWYAVFTGSLPIQYYGILAIIPIALYSGKKGPELKKSVSKIFQYFFYLFYPLHLFVLYIIKYIILQ